MDPGAVNLPPKVELSNYPVMVGAILGVVLVTALLFVSARFDPTHGELTISLLITVGMLGACTYCLMFTIPLDDITPGVIGGLTAGFGAVVAHWLGRNKGNGGPPPPPSAS